MQAQLGGKMRGEKLGGQGIGDWRLGIGD
jgi:hypothetical protein